MHPLRVALKKQLLWQAGGKPLCPLTGRPATDLHELIAWPGGHTGDKYGRHIRDHAGWLRLAEAYYVPELCILISNEANLDNADSHRLGLLAHKMGSHPLKVVRRLRVLARLIKQPEQYIPRSLVDPAGVEHVILRPGKELS